MSLPTTVSARTLSTAAGDEVRIPDPDHLIHLQFRRFAGCPVCNLHLRSIVTRLPEITAANIREVVVFHSSAPELRKYTDDLPFATIPDPTRKLYREFGVESAPKALLDLRTWPAILRGATHDIVATLRKKQPAAPTTPEGGRLGLPADFLIAPTGQVLAAKHGTHAYDQWSVDELLTLAKTSRITR